MMCPDTENPRCYFPDEKSFKKMHFCEPNGGLSMNNRDFINIRNGHTVDERNPAPVGSFQTMKHTK